MVFPLWCSSNPASKETKVTHRLSKDRHFLGYYYLKLQFRALCEIPRTDGLIEVLEWPFTHDFRGHNVFPLSEHSNTVYDRLSVRIFIYFRHFHLIVHFPNPMTFFFFGDRVLKTAFSRIVLSKKFF